MKRYTQYYLDKGTVYTKVDNVLDNKYNKNEKKIFVGKKGMRKKDAKIFHWSLGVRIQRTLVCFSTRLQGVNGSEEP